MNIKFYINSTDYNKMEGCLFDIAHILDDVEGKKIDIRYNLITRSYCIIVDCGVHMIKAGKIKDILREREVMFY